MNNLKKLLKIVPVLACAYASSAQALEFKFNYDASMDKRALAGFQSAANLWSSVLRDEVTVNLNIGFSQLAPGILGQTGSSTVRTTYNNFRNAMTYDMTTATDKAAVSGLSTKSCLNVYTNGTSVNPNGAGSATPFLDNNCNANNSQIRMTLANARALGVWYANDAYVDGLVSFSNTFNWDFNRADGIAANAFDFVGVAAHEIGHALGFISGVDYLDVNRSANMLDSQFNYIAPADVFRCSAASKAAGADLDFTADNRVKYFSFNNCNTALTTFSNGTTNGDGRQASHWKDNMEIGIMDPTAAYGEFVDITALDYAMFDAIGWNFVPEPGSIALFAFGAAGLAAARRRRK